MNLEWAHCHNCKKSLLKYRLEGDSTVEIKCHRCSKLNLITAKSAIEELRPDGLGGFILTAKQV